MPGEKLRVFLDSNVIISGLYSSREAPGKILELFIHGEIAVVVSRQVLEEVIRTVQTKLPEAIPALKRLLVNCPPEVVADPDLNELDRWRNAVHYADAAILVSAMKAQPNYFVTGDNHFVGNPGLARNASLNMVTPAQLLDLTGEDGGK